jgi:hypothetical protein
MHAGQVFVTHLEVLSWPCRGQTMHHAVLELRKVQIEGWDAEHILEIGLCRAMRRACVCVCVCVGAWNPIVI